MNAKHFEATSRGRVACKSKHAGEVAAGTTIISSCPRRLFCTLLFAIALLFTANAQQVPASLIGNWIETRSNQWEYGFFEHFAIHECAFWDYAAVQQRGKTMRITLRKGDRTLNLDVEPENDSLLTIKNGKSKKQDYMLARTRYPDYKTPDDTPFPAPTFRRDSATIIGYYRNFDRIPELLGGAPKEVKERYQAPFSVAINDFFKGEEVRYFTGIDSLGRFSITVPVINSQLTYVDWRRLTKQMLLSPGDTLFLFADVLDLLPRPSDKSWEDFNSRDKQILCMGDNARVNNELFQYKALYLSVNREEEMKKGISDTEYLRVCENVYNQRMEHLKKYMAARPALSEKFRFLRAIEEKYNFASYLMQHRFDVRDKNGYLPFQEGYMDYVNENFFSRHDPLIYMLVRDYESFICDYIGYYSKNQQVEYNLKNLLEEANLNTPENRQMVEKYEDVANKIMAEKDTLERGKILADNKELIEKVHELRAGPLIEEAHESYTMRKFMDMSRHKVDSLLQEPILKEWYMAHLYYKDFEQRRMPKNDADLQIMKSYIQNPFLLNMLLEINDKYGALNNQALEYPESLKNTDYLANETDADVILSKITSPYRGKVIFMDFWGTWCGPCIENIKEYSPLLEEKFKSEDLIFMYLANNSPESAWRSFIKQQHLTGAQIVHYRLPARQQYLLEQKLKVTDFPTYVIIDRAGNISDYKVRYPMDIKATIAELEKALNVAQ
ncbi:MAG: TlpA family protein disulfide reductase [Odoribacteraceae bacterium]|nr:TlpA family protein disulfide reductase [Odoribacteraceae bacterium]